MEGERRKRKMEKIEDDDEEEEEEEKMNKFFALIRRTREVRERIITTSTAVAGEQIQNPPSRPAATARVWDLAFQAEDFVDPCHNRDAVAAVNRSKIAIDLESPEVGPSNGGEELGKIVEKEEKEKEKEKEEDSVNEKEREELDLNLSL